MNRVLLVNTVPTEKNGITNVIFNYLSNIDGGDILFDYLSINEPDSYYRNEVEKRGGRLFVLHRLSMSFFSYWNRLRKLIRQNAYNAVHIHGNSHTVVLELSAVKAAGCAKGIVHAHSTSCLFILAHRLLTPAFNYLCDYSIACGEEAGHFMFGKRKFVVINNGVDVERFKFDADNRQKVRSLLCIKDNERLLGHVGYFQEVKNQRFIVEILRYLNSRYKLVLIGDGPQRQEVELLVREYGLSDRVIFSGNINNVDKYLSAIDLIVMPSLFEGVPLTLIEQQANGLHCVISDTITKEADKTGNLKSLSLESPVDEWVRCVENSEWDYDRESCSKNAIVKITEAGYNIAVEVKKLRKVYDRFNK